LTVESVLEVFGIWLSMMGWLGAGLKACVFADAWLVVLLGAAGCVWVGCAVGARVLG
jgi:hypothetical protein